MPSEEETVAEEGNQFNIEFMANRDEERMEIFNQRFFDYQFPPNGRRMRRRRRHHVELDLVHQMMEFQLRFQDP